VLHLQSRKAMHLLKRKLSNLAASSLPHLRNLPRRKSVLRRQRRMNLNLTRRSAPESETRAASVTDHAHVSVTGRVVIDRHIRALATGIDLSALDQGTEGVARDLAIGRGSEAAALVAGNAAIGGALTRTVTGTTTGATGTRGETVTAREIAAGIDVVTRAREAPTAVVTAVDRHLELRRSASRLSTPMQ